MPDETPYQRVMVRAADRFCSTPLSPAPGEPATFESTLAFGLSVVCDVAAGRVRPIQSYDAWYQRADVILSDPATTETQRLLILGVNDMVCAARVAGLP